MKFKLSSFLYKIANNLQEKNLTFSKPLEEAIKAIPGLKIGPFINEGSVGYVFEAFLNENSGIIKFTSSKEEVLCAKRIFDQKLWKKSTHLPQVYLVGNLPEGSVISDPEFAHFFSYPIIGFYVREAVTPFIAKIPKLSPELKAIVKSIEKSTGLQLTDTFPENFGKTKDGRIVYFDLSCR